MLHCISERFMAIAANGEGHANIQYYLQGTISYSYSLHKYKWQKYIDQYKYIASNPCISLAMILFPVQNTHSFILIKYILNSEKLSTDFLGGRIQPQKPAMYIKCTPTSTLVFPGTGTGALRSLRTQVSISLTSCMTSPVRLSVPWPVSTPQTVSLWV